MDASAGSNWRCKKRFHSGGKELWIMKKIFEEEMEIVKSLQITHKKLNESIKREIERLVSDKK